MRQPVDGIRGCGRAGEPCTRTRRTSQHGAPGDASGAESRSRAVEECAPAATDRTIGRGISTGDRGSERAGERPERFRSGRIRFRIARRTYASLAPPRPVRAPRGLARARNAVSRRRARLPRAPRRAHRRPPARARWGRVRRRRVAGPRRAREATGAGARSSPGQGNGGSGATGRGGTDPGQGSLATVPGGASAGPECLRKPSRCLETGWARGDPRAHPVFCTDFVPRRTVLEHRSPLTRPTRRSSGGSEPRPRTLPAAPARRPRARSTARGRRGSPARAGPAGASRSPPSPPRCSRRRAPRG